MQVSQLSVFIENKSGRLVDVTRALARAGINIRALSIAETIDYGLLRLIVNDPGKAHQFLADAGFSVTLTQVLAVAIPDRPGGLSGVIEILSGAGLNIEYLYAFVGTSGENAIVIFRVENTEEAAAILQSNGVGLLSGEDLESL